MFWDSNSDPPCANSIVLSTHTALSLIFFIFYRYFNHRYPLNFYRSFSILFSTYKSPKTLSILFEHRTLFKSSQTKFEGHTNTCTLCRKRKYSSSSSYSSFSSSSFRDKFRKDGKWKVSKVSGSEDAVSHEDLPYIETAHGPRFLFFYTISSHYSKLFVALVRRNILFLATRTRNLREMVLLYCHQVFTSTRFAFYHARRGKIKGIHDG